MSTRSTESPEVPTAQSARFHVTDLVVSRKQAGPALSFDTAPGLTLLHPGRENFATSLALALAGRMRTASGTIALETAHATYDTPRQRFPHVALAGAAEVDRLERLVPTEEIVREQIAWQQPAFRRAPRRALEDPRYTRWAEILGLDVQPSTPPGELPVLDRFRLRIVLGMIARPDAAILVVDDLDQVKSDVARGEILTGLHRLSDTLPVVASTVNHDGDGRATAVVTLHSGTEA